MEGWVRAWDKAKVPNKGLVKEGPRSPRTDQINVPALKKKEIPVAQWLVRTWDFQVHHLVTYTHVPCTLNIGVTHPH